jgi:hypothetical protein
MPKPIINHLLVALFFLLTIQVIAQRDTFPLTYDYAILGNTTYDVNGFCTCDRVKQSREEDGYTWHREAYVNCTYLDHRKQQVYLDQVWAKSKVPNTEWIKGKPYRAGRTAGHLYQEPRSIRDTFNVIFDYELNRQRVHEAAGECHCTGTETHALQNMKWGTVKYYQKCTWIDYEKGQLPDDVKIITAEGFPSPQWQPVKQ